MMLGKYFKKTVFRKEHTADGVVPEAPQGILKKCNACKGAIFTEDVKRNLYIIFGCMRIGGLSFFWMMGVLRNGIRG